MQSSALCGTVCALSIANSTFNNCFIASLSILLDFIDFLKLLLHDLIYVLMALLVTIAILYDLTI